MRDTDKSVPCYGCDKRHVGCHSSCESYKEYQKKIAEQREAIRKKKDEEAILASVHVRALDKANKKKSKVKYWKG